MRKFVIPIFLVTGIWVFLIIGVPVIASEVPVAVSPGGSPSGVAETTSCPMFSWSAVDDAQGYELAVLEVRTLSSGLNVSSLSMDGVDPALQVRIRGRALAWTPPRTQCFEAGRLYAWAVRAALADGAGAWSEVQLFRVPLAPTQEEVKEAVAVLLRLSGMKKEKQPVEMIKALTTEEEGFSEEQVKLRTSTVTGEELPSEVQGQRIYQQPLNTPLTFSLVLDGDLKLGRAIFKDNGVLLHNDGSNNIAVGLGALSNQSGSSNTAIGFNALASNETVSFNTAVGDRALTANTNGTRNTAIGMMALGSNTGGTNNTAVGSEALKDNVNGLWNVAVGEQALVVNQSGANNTAIGRGVLASAPSSSFNTGVGASALASLTSGSNIVAVGHQALTNLTVGSENIALGPAAGFFLTTGGENIFIGNQGQSADNKSIRIGTEGVHENVFMAGILGHTVTNGPATVMIGPSGQLGIGGSSRRFKKDIRNIGKISEKIFNLRPVTFRYVESSSSEVQGSLLQYGLIAEEVADVLPGLVISDSEGRPLSVRYDLLTPLLVKEMQRQEHEITRLRERLRKLEKRTR